MLSFDARTMQALKQFYIIDLNKPSDNKTICALEFFTYCWSINLCHKPIRK